jgi:hypothetical protein
VLLFGGMAGAALWPYWPELPPWLDDLKSVEWNSSARDTARPPATGQSQERVNIAPTPAAPGKTPLAPAASMTPLPDAPAGIVADAPLDNMLANEPSSSPGAQENPTALAGPTAELEPLPKPDPVREPVLAPIVSPRGDVAPAGALRFAPLGFRQGQYVVTENDVAVMLDIDYPRSLTAPVSLSVIIEPGTAKAYEDFMPLSMQSIVAGPGQPAAKIILPVVSDSVDEYTEDFLVRLVPDDPAVQIARPETVIIILDDDALESVESPDQNAGVQEAAE